MDGEPRHSVDLVRSCLRCAVMQVVRASALWDLWISFELQFLVYLSLFSIASGYIAPDDQGTRSYIVNQDYGFKLIGSSILRFLRVELTQSTARSR